MSTTTNPRRQRRSLAEWESIADEVLPRLQRGDRLSEFAGEFGSNTDALKTALAKRGYDPRGEPLDLKEITARSPKTLATKVAKQRRAGVPWWLIKAQTGKSYGELIDVLTEYGYSTSGENLTNGS